MIDNFERAVGRIIGGNTLLEINGSVIQMVKSVHAGDDQVSIFSTLGLNRFPLLKKGGRGKLRVELLICLSAICHDGWVASAGKALAKFFIDQGKSIERGSWIDKKYLCSSENDIPSFYFTIPLFIDEDKRLIFNESNDEVLLIWALPVTETEINYLVKEGWEKFENKVDEYLENTIFFPRYDIVK